MYNHLPSYSHLPDEVVPVSALDRNWELRYAHTRAAKKLPEAPYSYYVISLTRRYNFSVIIIYNWILTYVLSHNSVVILNASLWRRTNEKNMGMILEPG